MRMRFVSMEDRRRRLLGLGKWRVGVSADSGCGAARGGSAGCEVCRGRIERWMKCCEGM